MDGQQTAIVKGLVAVAWADGVFADREREVLEGVLDAYGASAPEREALRAYAATRRSLEDIDVQELSADDRRALLHHAVLVAFADGQRSADEGQFLRALAAKLRIGPSEAEDISKSASAWAQRSLHLIDPDGAGSR